LNALLSGQNAGLAVPLCTVLSGEFSPHFDKGKGNPPLPRGDGEETPLAGDAFELVSAAFLELES
jgi:hypothetical protein